MRILAIGDFHGKFPAKLKKKIRKEKVDLILCTGDYADAEKIRKLIFKYWKEKPWWEGIGLKKAKQLKKQSFDTGVKVLKELNSLNKKVCTIIGNLDFYRDYRWKKKEILDPGFYEECIKKLRNIILIEKKKIKFKGVEILGHGKYLDLTDFIRKKLHKDKKKQEGLIKRYKKDAEKLKNFLMRKKPSEGFVFLAHCPPYGYFDKIKFKDSPMHGKRGGFEPYISIIKKYKPSLFICGHIHEYQGKKRLGNTLIITTGAAQDGKAAIIDFDEKKKKVGRIKFIK